ncbi:hypothetical protein FRC03_008337 [Tulasnella sp. 419]|nr:hypothetical protein FRC02_009001 [Tulasnella sp. 418]KAG8968202.1 hypothetical protein FRC03_008337 [Tulasnella sp. 419]
MLPTNALLIRVPRRFITPAIRSSLLLRNLATHRESPASSLLSQQLDSASQRASSSSTVDSVGPFTLGIRNNPANNVKQKKWSELSAGGKVVRGTSRTASLTVIIIGGAFSCVLAYALATELFAKNSPTRLYDDACKKVLASEQVASYLKSPLRFHTNAPSPLAPRHRNRHVSSQLAIDGNGREHLLLHFYVEAASQASDSSFFSSTPSLSDLSFSTFVDWVQAEAQGMYEGTKRVFAYIAGSPMPTLTPVSNGSSNTSSSPSISRHTQIGKPSRDSESSGWGATGLFGSLFRRKAASSGGSDVEDGIEFTGGEVHADLVKDADGNFQYRYLLVDIPYSRAAKSRRVYVEKGLGFREGEGVFMWG